MKKLITILLLSLSLFSCIDNDSPEIHEVTFLRIDKFKKRTVLMYDNNLQKRVIIYYSEKLFHCNFGELCNINFVANPTFLFYYLDGQYYSG